MRIHPLQLRPESRRCTGVSLIECLVYVGLLSTIMGVAYLALYQATDNTKGLRRNADDITAALNVGERWRQDIRAASGPIQVESRETNQMIRIPQTQGEVIYAFAAGQLTRQQQSDAPQIIVLPRVKSSAMTLEVRNQISAWRWELTLASRTRSVRLKPMFSFAAVPGTKASP